MTDIFQQEITFAQNRKIEYADDTFLCSEMKKIKHFVSLSRTGLSGSQN